MQNSGFKEIHLSCLFARWFFTAGLESDFFRYLLSTYQLISSLGFWWIHDSKSDSHSCNLRKTVSHLLHPILELTSFLNWIKTPKLLQVSVIIIIINNYSLKSRWIVAKYLPSHVRKRWVHKTASSRRINGSYKQSIDHKTQQQ